MPDDLDLIGGAAFDVVENGTVGELRIRGQLIARKNEVKAKMRRQDRSCRDRLVEDDPRLGRFERNAGGLTAARLRRGKRLVKDGGRVPLDDADRAGAGAAIGIGQHDIEFLARTPGQRQQRQRKQEEAAHRFRPQYTLTAKVVPLTPRMAVGVLIFIAPGVLRVMSPETTLSEPFFTSASISPLKLLESKRNCDSATCVSGPVENTVLSMKVRPIVLPGAPVSIISLS